MASKKYQISWYVRYKMTRINGSSKSYVEKKTELTSGRFSLHPPGK